MNIGLATLCSSEFMPGLKVLLKSFVEHNGIGHQFHVFCIDPDNFRMEDVRICKGIYPNIIFRAVALEDYNNIDFQKSSDVYNAFYFNYRKEIRKTHQYTYYKYEIFTLESQYDKVIYFDSDMLITGDLSYLFDLDCDFGAVKELKANRFNGGLLVVGKKYLNASVKHALINMSRIADKKEADQYFLNQYFKDFFPIPYEYNILKSDYRVMGSWFSNCKIFHYIVRKPWDDVYVGGGDAEVRDFDKMWWNCYGRI